MFVGREDELRDLQQMYDRSGLNTCCIYGRRQIGKSTLIKEFIKDKRHLYVQFARESEYECISRLRYAILECLGVEVPDDANLVDLFHALKLECRKEKTIIVIDEYPFIADACPSFPTSFQAFIDSDLYGLDAFVMICGSSTSVMNDVIRSYDSPLYQRFTNKMQIKPMTLEQCDAFHPGMSDMDRIRTYLLVGGVPKYHVCMSEDTFEDSLIRCFIGPNATLLREGEQVVTADLPNSIVHTGIISCIADGKVEAKRIRDSMAISDSSALTKLMKPLIDLYIVDKVRPMLGAPSREIRYEIRDNMVRFYYSVLRKYETLITDPNPDPSVAYRTMKSDVDTFLGMSFEKLCAGYLVAHRNVVEIGRWWGSDGGEHVDVDIVAKVLDDNLKTGYVVAECKFRNRKAAVSVAYTLMERAERMRGLVNPEFMIFSIGGFEDKLVDFAEDHGIRLVGMEGFVGGTDPEGM